MPVFLDVDVPTYNVDVTHLEDALTSRTKAVHQQFGSLPAGYDHKYTRRSASRASATCSTCCTSWRRARSIAPPGSSAGSSS